MRRIVSSRRQALRGIGALLLGILAGGQALASGPGGGGPGGGGPGGGGPGNGGAVNPLVGIWEGVFPLVLGGPALPTRVVFFANGQFSMAVMDPTTGVSAVISGTWAIDPSPPRLSPVLTLTSNQIPGAVVLQGMLIKVTPELMVIDSVSGEIDLTRISF